MNLPRSFAFFASLSLAAALSVGGCKANNNTATTSPSAQPSSDASPAAATAASAAGQAAAPEGSAPASGGSQQASALPPPPPPPAVISLPKGTQLSVRLDSDLGSEFSHAGDAFTATVAQNVTVSGQTVIPRGARAEGVVVDAKPLGHFKGGALLSVRLERVHTRWGSYPVATSSISRAERGKGKRTGLFAGGGAAFGAIVGGLAGGGKGAAIGALAGGGAGTAGGALTGNKQIMLPAETVLTFQLEHGVHITEQAAQEPQLEQR